MSTTVAIIGSLVAITSTILILYGLNSGGYFDRFQSREVLPEQKECGVPLFGGSSSGNNAKIINGFEAKPNSFPWIVSLRVTAPGNAHFCGGSLIYDQYVLTAAHCVNTFRPADIGVAVGIHKINDTLSSDNFYQVSAIKLHERYSNYFLSNDIAILKLSRPISRSNKTTIICLPASIDSASDVFDKDVITAGWGSTNGQNSPTALSDALKQGNLKVYGNQNICQRNSLFNFNRNRNYCAIDESTDKSNVCFGDSGGPLMFIKDNKWYLYGVTSFVLTEQEKCNNRLPSYFVRVPAYINWIVSTLKSL